MINAFKLLNSVHQIIKLSKPAREFAKGNISLPILIQVQSISACNGRCTFCPYPFTYKDLPQGKMDWETYTKIVDECVTFPSLQMFTPMLQNEPLLDKDLCREIRYFKEKDSRRVPVFIITNGYLLTSTLVKNLVDSGLNHLIISINAHKKETYEELMPGFKLEKLIKIIEDLLSADLGKTKITLRYLETVKNKKEIGEALEYWKKRRVRTEVLSFISNRADTVDITNLRTKESDLSLSTKIKQKTFSVFSNCCILPFYQMNILFNGDVIICCNDWKRNPVLGNVKNQKISDIWLGEKANRLRESILKKNYKAIPACKGCSMTEYFESWK